MPSITLCIMIASGYERAGTPAIQSERLELLLRSIFHNSYGQLLPESHMVYVVDDYSTNRYGQERCAEVCRKFGVNYLKNPGPWKGPCGNYNYAVSNAPTEYIAMLGDDQFCSPGWWEYMYYYIKNNPSLKWGMLGWSVIFMESLISSGYFDHRDEMYTTDRIWSLNLDTLPEEAFKGNWCNWDKPRVRGHSSGTAFVIKKSLWQRFGGFWEELFQFDEDYGDNVWNLTDNACIQVPTPPIFHYAGACEWPPDKGSGDPIWRRGWETRPFVKVRFEDRGETAKDKIVIFSKSNEVDNSNYLPISLKKDQHDLVLDLGCGKNKRHPNSIGLDIVGKPATNADIICNLGFQRLPFPNDSCKLVLAHDLLEHIPHTVWINENGIMKRLQPTVQLFNEVYRVLHQDGLFETNTPVYPHEGLIQDPTHSSLWSPTTFQYFANNYYGFKEGYGHKSNFKIVSERWDDIHYHVVLRTDKL